MVVYPYNENYYINPQSCNVEATLPATQTYIANSYGLDGNIMVSSSEYNQVYLRSVCGWLKIQLTGAGQTVEKITLKGNNGEQVAGQLYIDTTDASVILAENMVESDDNGLGGMLEFDNTILTEVTLNCSGVTLGAEPTAFYIALPPQTFENGFTATMYNNKGLQAEISTNKAITIERNHITPMASVGIEMSIPYDEIWYTSTTDNVVTTSNQNGFDANIISNTYENGKGIIKFDNKITSIGSGAFRTNQQLTSITIPCSVTEIGGLTFENCANLTSFYGKFASDDNRCLIQDTELIAFAPADLTSYTIPNNVTKIGGLAFNSCFNLTSITIPDSVIRISGLAFEGCSSLKEVYCKPTTPPSGGSSMFYSNASGCKIYVPRASVDAYKAASYWSDYKSYIEPYDF